MPAYINCTFCVPGIESEDLRETICSKLKDCSVQNTLQNLINNSDLEKKSGFTYFTFVFYILDKEFAKIMKKTPGDVSFLASKREKSLEIETNVDFDEVQSYLTEDRIESFAISRLYETLKLTCKKYQAVIPSAPPNCHRETPRLAEKETLDFDAIEWLELNIPVSSYFGGDEKDDNYDLFEQLETILEKKNLGFLEALESGAGYNTGIFRGADSTKMLIVFRQILQDLPKDSFIQIKHNGEEIRIEQSEIRDWCWSKK